MEGCLAFVTQVEESVVAVILAWNDSWICCFLCFCFVFRLMAIQQCDLVLVHIYPQGEETLVSDRPKKEVGASEEWNIIALTRFCSKNALNQSVNGQHLDKCLVSCGRCDLSLLLLHLVSQISPLLTSEVHSVRAGRHLATKLNILVQQHFDLASTTITNIPMKVRHLFHFTLS